MFTCFTVLYLEEKHIMNLHDLCKTGTRFIIFAVFFGFYHKCFVMLGSKQYAGLEVHILLFLCQSQAGVLSLSKTPVTWIEGFQLFVCMAATFSSVCNHHH